MHFGLAFRMLTFANYHYKKGGHRYLVINQSMIQINDQMVALDQISWHCY